LNWVDENVAIGNFLEANDVHLLREKNIDLIIDVRTAFNTNARFEFLLHRKILNSERAQKISILLTALFNLKSKVLVHCLEGVDRTPFVVMLYVAQKYGMTFKDAYYLVKQKRPQTRFHWRWVRDYENFLQSQKTVKIYK
jgi:protein-tyrosine phosphatase